MDTYTALRQFADSWALLAMVLFFLGVVLRSIAARSEDIQRAAALPLDDRTPRDFEAEGGRAAGPAVADKEGEAR